MIETHVTNEIYKIIRKIEVNNTIKYLFDDKVQNELIPKLVEYWIKDKPWKHLKDAIMLCAKYSPLVLTLIINDRLEGGGKITYSVFGKKPSEVPTYFNVYPLDIFLYAVRIDMMRYDDLREYEEDFFMNKVANTKAFRLFKEAVKEFTE